MHLLYTSIRTVCPKIHFSLRENVFVYTPSNPPKIGDSHSIVFPLAMIHGGLDQWIIESIRLLLFSLSSTSPYTYRRFPSSSVQCRDEQHKGCRSFLSFQNHGP